MPDSPGTPRKTALAQNPWTREQESVACRTCKAEAGQQCVTASGTRAPLPHAARFNDAVARRRGRR